MKKIINSKVFAFILGVVVCSATTALASTMLASNIAYIPKDSTWKVDNVEAAIDSLKLSKTESNYSTEEQVVGTWIDGKPLYQKTFVFEELNLTGNNKYNDIVSVADLNVDNLCNIVLKGDKNIFYPFTIKVDNNGILKAYVIEQNEKINSATIQYTKTTDSAN